MSTWQQIIENQTAIPKEELSLIVTLSFLQAQLAKIENLDCTPTLAMLNKYAKGLGLEIKLSILPLESTR